MNQELLKKYLHYSKDTGVFTWIKLTGKRVSAGSKAGCKYSCGYIFIRLLGKRYAAHRLAFLYVEGKLPENHVDHINRVRFDNRWANLRHATRRENMNNMKNNRDFTGVFWNRLFERWVAVANKDKERITLGCFKTNIAACYAKHFWNIQNNY